jgi:hypothetical protein
MNQERQEICKSLIKNLTKHDPALTATAYRYYTDDGTVYRIRIEREGHLTPKSDEEQTSTEGFDYNQIASEFEKN